MFGLFGNKKKEEVSLADRIKANPLAAEPAAREEGVKTRVPFAGFGTVGGGDMKSAYLTRAELTAERLRELYDVPGACSPIRFTAGRAASPDDDVRGADAYA